MTPIVFIKNETIKAMAVRKPNPKISIVLSVKLCIKSARKTNKFFFCHNSNRFVTRSFGIYINN